MEVKYCVRCGREVDAKATVCPHCGAALPTLEEVNRTREKELNNIRSPWTAAFLSFLVVGLGHLYAGEIGRRLAFFIFTFVFFAFSKVSLWFAPLFWLAAAIDAYRVTKMKNEGLL